MMSRSLYLWVWVEVLEGEDYEKWNKGKSDPVISEALQKIWRFVNDKEWW